MIPLGGKKPRPPEHKIEGPAQIVVGIMVVALIIVAIAGLIMSARGNDGGVLLFGFGIAGLGLFVIEVVARSQGPVE